MGGQMPDIPSLHPDLCSGDEPNVVRPHAVQFLSQQHIFTASEYAALPPPSVSQTDFLLINWPIFERVLALDCVLAPNYLNSRQVTVLCAN
jgi:hypothetical protein